MADNILRAIRRILRKTSEHSRQLASAGNLSVPQLLCLRAIARTAAQEDPPTLAMLAEQVQLSTATVSRILDRLDNAGLIARVRSEVDRRKYFVSLTTKGKRQVAKLPQPLHEEFLRRLTGLKKGDQLRLLSALEEIVELMGAANLDAAPMLTPESNVKPAAVRRPTRASAKRYRSKAGRQGGVTSSTAIS